MNENTKNGEGFIGYEYKEVIASRDMASVYADGYPNFGWAPDTDASAAVGIFTTVLKFKRDRKIRNKAELTRLQRQFEGNVKEIEKLEQSRTTTANIAACCIGLVGTAFMAGSVFAFLANMIALFIILAIPACIGWILPYFTFLKMKAKRIRTMTPLIDQQYDSIYETCEKAHSLLAK